MSSTLARSRGRVRAGRSALEAMGVHPYEAERQARGFNREDRAAIRRLAELYDPDIPTHRNEAYVAKAKEIRAEQEQAMRGQTSSFWTRNDRGWVPPRPADVEAAEKDAKAQR